MRLWGTHRTGVSYNVRNILGGINSRYAVCALLGDVGETWNDKGEALAVDHMPVECIDLCSGIIRTCSQWRAIDTREPKNMRQACA